MTINQRFATLYSVLTTSRASYYIVATLILISWAIIGIQLRTHSYTTDPGEGIHTERRQTEWIHAFKYIIPTSSIPLTPSPSIPTTDQPTQTITDSALLWLINQDNPLGKDFIPSNMVSHKGIRMQAAAYTAFNQMLVALKNDGIIGLQLASAYRTYEHQHSLFTSKVNTLISQGHNPHEAEELAQTTIQRPGASEHQTGLALDVTMSGDLTKAFADTPAGKWVAANSHRFGFIIRYPQSKTEITHIIYEPWHLRYVGMPHATIMYENNLSLEEYASFIAAGQAYIVWICYEEYFIVMHTTTWPNSSQPELVDISSVSPSGGGYILTVRRHR